MTVLLGVCMHAALRHHTMTWRRGAIMKLHYATAMQQCEPIGAHKPVSGDAFGNVLTARVPNHPPASRVEHTVQRRRYRRPKRQMTMTKDGSLLASAIMFDGIVAQAINQRFAAARAVWQSMERGFPQVDTHALIARHDRSAIVIRVSDPIHCA
ncbi:hypothetical protein [Roseiflexus castenholzii]|uniref:hypothetical protein n=1 Tax=Roseiflexus castenholzii TaxID=120962 RepID=UPI003C7B5627